MALRITKSHLEVLRSVDPAPFRVTLDYIEVLRTAEPPPVRVTKDYVEVLVGALPPTWITQDYLEVLLAPTPPDIVSASYTNISANYGEYLPDLPWYLYTTVGTVTHNSLDTPFEVETETFLEAWVNGEVEFEDGTGLPLTTVTKTYTNVTAVAVTLLASPPTLLHYSNVTGVEGLVASNAPLAFETVTGARSTETILIDGRRDLIDTKRYKR